MKIQNQAIQHAQASFSSQPTYTNIGNSAVNGNVGFPSSNYLGELMSMFQELSSAWGGFVGAPPQAPAQPNPFFANFLEDQRAVFQQPPVAVTMAFPSDGDVGGPRPGGGGGISVTMAFPSDGDVGGPKPGGGGGISVTMAFPSDGDVGGPKPGGGGGISVTMAFPSDGDVGAPRPRPGGPGPGISVTMAFPSDGDRG